MTQYNIRYIHLFPAFKFGCLVGGLVLLLPGLLLGLLVRVGVGILRDWLDGWEAWELDAPLASLPEVDLLELLNLADVLNNLRVLDDDGWLLVLALTLVSVFGGGLLAGFLTALGAAGYNILAQISGGLVVSAEVLNGLGEPALGPVPPKRGTLPLPPSAQRGPPPPGPPVRPAPSGGPSPLAPPGGSPSPAPVSPVTPASPGIGAWMTLKQNPQQRWPVKIGITTIGSTPGNDVILAGLLPRHAEIRFENNRYILRNLGGGQILVNNRPIKGDNMLKDGFSIRLEKHDLIFRAG